MVLRLYTRRLFIGSIAILALLMATSSRAEVINLFTTQEDFAGWSDGKNAAQLKMAPTDADLDQGAVNGMGNTSAARAAGKSGALAVTWQSGDYNTIQSPGQQQNDALVDALGDGSDRQILVDFTTPPQGKGNWFSLLLNLNYDGVWTTIAPKSVVEHGTHRTATYDYTFNRAGMTYLSVGLIYSSNYNPATPFIVDNMRIVTKAREKAQDLPAPRGVVDYWKMESAWKQDSPTRAVISLNGLWRFYPVDARSEVKPPGPDIGWGWFKVPGSFGPKGKAQTALLPQAVEERFKAPKSERPTVEAAWYQRTFTVPRAWQGRKVLLDLSFVQVEATVFVDGQQAGLVTWPGGMLDITALAKPAQQQTLHVLVKAAQPHQGVKTWFGLHSDHFRTLGLDHRGLTGDVFLLSEPLANALGDTHVITSVRKHQVTFDTAVTRVTAGQLRLEAAIYQGEKQVLSIASPVLTEKDIVEGRVQFTGAWKDPELWDLDTPQNLYTTVVALKTDDGKLLDQSHPITFGFREFWIDGSQFRLNGSRVHLRMLLADNPTQTADVASLAGSLNTCKRVQAYGFNALITTPYGYMPGEVGYAEDFYRATDQSGMLIAYSMPNILHYGWAVDVPEIRGEFERLANYLVRRAQNHPSVVAYSMNHNGLVYYDLQNPLKIDGVYTPDTDPRQVAWRANARKLAVDVVAGYVKKLDPTRPSYAHAAGNLGDMVTLNAYFNWAPRQERSDWFEHWATKGAKPLMLIEYGLPHIANWSSYRGPEFIWGTPQRQFIWDRENAATFFGEEAYNLTQIEKDSIATQLEMLSRPDKFWFGEMLQHLVRQEHNFHDVQAYFLKVNFPDFRVWGISGYLPWDQDWFWYQVKPEPAQAWANNYENLQKPGIVPDIRLPQKSYTKSWKDEEFKPSAVAQSLLRVNTPLLAYIVGSPEHFTERGHNFSPGQTIQKQLAIVNDSRRPVRCSWSWDFHDRKVARQGEIEIQPGEKAFVPVQIVLAPDQPAGSHVLRASFTFSTGEAQNDTFAVHVVPKASPPIARQAIALLDPAGDTAKYLQSLGVTATRFQQVQDLPSADQLRRQFGLLIIGRNALADAPAIPQISAVEQGLKVLVFEQTPQTLQDKWGFRVQQIGYRQAFVRSKGHPALKEMTNELLRDWRGSSTLVRPYLDLPFAEKHSAVFSWCGFENDRVWRAGNHGAVMSVVIEKPPVGNFLPLIDCGFDLQYSPLLEYTPSSGDGRIVFCQLDVTGRTIRDPAAEQLTVNLVRYLEQPNSTKARRTLYAGDTRGEALLKTLGIAPQPFTGGALPSDALLIIGPGATKLPSVEQAVQGGANVLGLGLAQAEVDALLPSLVKLEQRQVSPVPLKGGSEGAYLGVSSADVFWRNFPLVHAITSTSGAGNESLRAWTIGKGAVVLCQATPWMFQDDKTHNLRTTYRRNVFLVSRLLHNLGAVAQCPLEQRMAQPPGQDKAPWLHSYYTQEPMKEDDPYRFFGW